MKRRLAAIAGLCVFATTAASACQLNTEFCRLDSNRVQWSGISLEARKFIFSASTRAKVELVTSDNLPLISTDQGVPVVPSDQALQLRAESRGLGIHSDSVLWMDSFSGAALQYEVEDSGRRARQRIYRYTDEGAFHRTRYPDDGEADSPPEKWTRLDSGFSPYAPDTVNEIVIDPIGLLYIIAASRLDQPGDTLRTYAFSRRQTTRLILTVEKRASIDKSLAEHLSSIDMAGCGQPTEALLVRLSSEPLPQQDGSDFSFLGLRSDISIWLDPTTRLPLRITGKAKIVGQVSVNLGSAECQ